MPKKSVSQPWLATLQQLVEAKPCVVVQLDENDSARLTESKYGFNEFTMVRSHDMLSGIKTPTACLVFGSRPHHKDGAAAHGYLGIVSSRGPIATLDTRIKIRRAVRIEPNTVKGLVALLGSDPHAGRLREKLESEQVVVLSPKLSSTLIQALAGIPANQGPMRAVTESLHSPRYYTNFSAVQEDAVQTALKAFGLSASDRAERVELVEKKASALARVPLKEDAVVEQPTGIRGKAILQLRTPLIEDSAIEKDTRSVPGYTLKLSHLTGRAIFTKGLEKLEIITANRRDLEHVFGVDLIYVNITKKNIVMVQYKMLEPNSRNNTPNDWLYRPDTTMAKEITRMKRFASKHAPGALEYRLNPQVFYLKFVKRNGALSNGSILTPLDHYEQLLADPACQGPRKAIRISYQSLNGRYMRQGAFLDLVQSGYIGAYATTTAHLSALIKAVLDGNRAVVAAVQSSLR
jgi:hypothetical protein